MGQKIHKAPHDLKVANYVLSWTVVRNVFQRLTAWTETGLEGHKKWLGPNDRPTGFDLRPEIAETLFQIPERHGVVKNIIENGDNILIPAETIGKSLELTAN